MKISGEMFMNVLQVLVTLELIATILWSIYLAINEIYG
jgi:hypothetical protein